ncbi:class II aldolase/adducin family protein [Acidovorax sp. sif1233]|uniref:class II aldolase/adducin family protein n=1 Tax=Acidovorax sp. sif1233 TaxID=2854792 RepID=UPI002101DB71|nr:class II aldolase/adducin family protein [Acidovorax sp. sif1233]
MIGSRTAMEHDVRSYCAKIGTDPLLVQGAGGNASWKEGDTLWIKASGTWLSNAEKENIFVPVDLSGLNAAIARDCFSETPRVVGDFTLRPSIETMLHALMPHRIVLHLHAVEALAHLVRKNYLDDLQALLRRVVDFAAIEYLKPGECLARATAKVLRGRPDVNVIFLANHGVVLGGESIAEIDDLLSNLLTCLRCERIMKDAEFLPFSAASAVSSYMPVDDIGIQQLALDDRLFRRLQSDWALYPDHVVFLGPVAHVYASGETFQNENCHSDSSPEIVFINEKGVFAKSSFTQAKKAQLRCYFDVLVRQQPECKLNVLTGDQIAELLNWDAEKYRVTLAKSATNVSSRPV